MHGQNISTALLYSISITYFPQILYLSEILFKNLKPIYSPITHSAFAIVILQDIENLQEEHPGPPADYTKGTSNGYRYFIKVIIYRNILCTVNLPPHSPSHLIYANFSISFQRSRLQLIVLAT